MKFTITKEQILELSKINAVIKERLNEAFPKAFKIEFKVGKWYKHTSTGNIIYCSKIANDGTLYGYGFMSGQFKVYEDETSGYCICNSISTKHLIEATDKEVEEALIDEAKKRGFVDGAKFKSSLSEDGKIRTVRVDESSFFDFNNFFSIITTSTLKSEWEDTIAQSNPYIFRDGIWATIIPQEKTTISKEKALKILAKKLKVSPENIEIQ